MAKLISLSAERKLRDRSKKKAQADANSVKFGLTKADRALLEAKADKARRDLDQRKRDPE